MVQGKFYQYSSLKVFRDKTFSFLRDKLKFSDETLFLDPISATKCPHTVNKPKSCRIYVQYAKFGNIIE